MSKPWDEIHLPNATPNQIAKEYKKVLRQYNRPWWKLVRLYDRITRRGTK